MARWRLHLVLLLALLLIAALATWRISGYPPEVRAALALQRPLLGLRLVQVLAGVCALVCSGLLLRDRLEDHDDEPRASRRYNWLCPSCHHIVEAERDICPWCGATRTGLSRA